MKNLTRAIALIAPLFFLASACSSDGATDATDTTSGSSESAESPEEAAESSKVGMALPGERNDQGFSEAHFRGLELAKSELGIETSVIDSATSPEDTVSALTSLAADNDLVIGVGAEFDEAGRVVAPQFPDVTFMVINGSVDPDIPNLYSYGIRQGVPAYIATIVAGSLEGAETIGYIGGLEIPPVTQSATAVEAAASEVGLSSLSTITGDFNDIALAKSATEAQLAEGANVIYGLVDAGFTGVIQAAEASGTDPYVFGSIFPRCDAYANIVGTAIAGSDQLVNSMVADFLNDTLPETPLFYGVENPDIQRVELCPNFQTDELQKIIDDTTQGIIDGSITLPGGI